LDEGARWRIFPRRQVTLRNSYLYFMPQVPAPEPWHPPERDDAWLPDATYWGAVFAEMDRRVDRDDLVVIMTEELEELPQYGPNVVVLLIADEKAHVPAYIDKVGAVFKNLAIRPRLTTSVVREPAMINVWWFVEYLRLWYHHAPGALRRLGHRARRRPVAPMWPVPVGTFNQVELPVRPLAERGTDLFFAGSVTHKGERGVRDRIAPKVISRTEMVKAAERLGERRPDIDVKLVDTGAYHLSIGQSGLEYSQGLMDARIALVPRGVIADTFRFWQAIRYGCVVVTDSMPRDPWLYDGAPVVTLRTWDRLEDVVVPLLADEERMADLHRRSLEWWRTRADPAAVGARMAERLNTLAR
jgi:hypothetical protein